MGEVTVPRRTFQANTSFTSPEVSILQADAAMTVVWDMPDAEALDPACRSKLTFEVSLDNGQSWGEWGSAVTWGSPLRDVATPPAFATLTPPAGSLLRARFEAFDAAVHVGFHLYTIEGVRTIFGPEHHSVAYDDGDGVSGTAVGQLTTPSFTIAGENRACLANVTWIQSGIDVSSVTGPTTFTAAGTKATVANLNSQVWKGVAPSTGSQTVTVNFSDTWGTNLYLFAYSLTGVDQTTPTSDYNTATGTSDAPSVTIANTTTGDMAVSCCQHGGSGITTCSTGTARWNYQAGATFGSTQDGASGVITWDTEFSDDWAITGLRVRQATGAANLTVFVFENTSCVESSG